MFDQADGFTRAWLVDVTDRDGGAATRQLQRRRPTNAGPGSRDERD
jgi:hypothetical protein